MIRLTGKIGSLYRDLDGNGVVTFTTSILRGFEELKSLDPFKDYSIEIKQIKSKRSLQQNRMLWGLIGLIDEKENGRRTAEGSEGIYITLLEMADAKVDFIAALPEAEKMLRQSFRAIKLVQPFRQGGQQMNLYKVVSGSSKMNTKEMSALIDTTLDYAARLGIDTDYWKEVLK